MSSAEKLFTEEEAWVILKALIESGSLKLVGSSSEQFSAQEGAENDALYLKCLWACLTSEYLDETRAYSPKK